MKYINQINLPWMINWTVFKAILYLHETVNEPIVTSWIGHIPPEHWLCTSRLQKKIIKKHFCFIINIRLKTFMSNIDRKVVYKTMFIFFSCPMRMNNDWNRLIFFFFSLLTTWTTTTTLHTYPLKLKREERKK